MRYSALCFGFLIGLTGCGGSGGTADQSSTLAKGKTLYELNCKSCHGAEGHGDGPAGASMKLRDFAKHPWLTSPDEASIRKSIVEGIAGTAMPAFKSLTPAEVDAIVTFTMTLTPKEPAAKSTSQLPAIEAGKFGFAALDPVRVAPPLEFLDAKLQPMTLAAFRGSWKVLHFWSINDKTFEPDLKCLEKLATEIKKVQFLVIGGDEHDPVELAVVSENAINTLPIYSIRNTSGLGRYGVSSLPVTFILDPDGNLLARRDGKLDEGKLRELLTSMIS